MFHKIQVYVYGSSFQLQSQSALQHPHHTAWIKTKSINWIHSALCRLCCGRSWAANVSEEKDERQLLRAVWAFKLTELVEFPKNAVQTPNPLKSTWAALTSPSIHAWLQTGCEHKLVRMHEFAFCVHTRVRSPKQHWVAAYHGVTLLPPPII